MNLLIGKQFHILLFSGRNIFISPGTVVLPVSGDDLGYGLLRLGRLLLKISLGAAPFLGGVARQLAAVNGEHLPADHCRSSKVRELTKLGCNLRLAISSA